ncbi:GNAT family N-acetyltransferase [Kineosporia succinea]|uniref:GNAT superfamily N-acetyltransferase n=1 Tax=Kineosporia succinea TaxID=84632 RepID=A0ABT9PBG5_9ACTN|nr:GNAT family N-acetyltransferase [Kineosporia succinea]MDP9830013.1 GNAT superfamily N-acetyltransferase [Kineosporia succinea]
MTIRPARTDDLPRLRDIERAAGEAFRGIGMAPVADDEPFGIDELERYRANGRAWVHDAHGPAAYLLMDVVDGAFHIEQVTVHPAAARQGVGRALIEHLAGQARRHGVGALTLTTFEHVPWNAPYYARLGFRLMEQPGPELLRVRAREREHGLDRWPRVAMVRDL